MNSRNKSNPHESLIVRYLEALEHGDLVEVSLILEQAEHSPALEAMLLEINDALYAEDEHDTFATIEAFEEPPPTDQAAFQTDDTEEPLLIALPLPSLHELPLPQPSSSLFTSSLVGAFSGFAAFVVCALLYPAWFSSSPTTVALRPTQTHTNAMRGASPSLQTTPPSRRVRVVKASITPQPLPITLTSWQRGTWVETIHRRPSSLERLLKPSPAQRDLLALLQNQKLAAAIVRRVKPTEITPQHRIIRARLLLRMARFHHKNYQLSLSFHQAVFTRRLKRSQKLQLGRLYHYYWGRLRCLQGHYKDAVASLTIAAQQVPHNRLARVQAWLAVCSTRPSQRTPHLLSTLRFSNDPDGWAEWVLLHHLFKLKTSTQPRLLTPRAQLYAHIWHGQTIRWPTPLLRTHIDHEVIQEQNIRTQLHYYDPAIFVMLAAHYTQRALKHLKLSPKDDRYAPFYRAEARYLLGQNKRAKAQWSRFLAHPPQSLNMTYLLFSHRLSPRFLREEALYYQALLDARNAPARAQATLHTMAKASIHARALAGLGLVRLNVQPQQSYHWLLQSVNAAQQHEQRLHERYLADAENERNPTRKRGAQIITQLRLARYLVRALYLWGSMGAIHMNDGARAARWMERLHCKDDPYKITDINEPLQFTWTARAYTNAGNLGVATLFFAKNRKAYPSLTQLWSLLRIWRIFEGMNSVPRVKAG